MVLICSNFILVGLTLQFPFRGSLHVTYPFYAPLNLQADKLVKLIIILTGIQRSCVLFLTFDLMIL